MAEVKFQIGKNGFTQGVIESLKMAFKTHHQVRISVLRSSGRDRSNIDSMARELTNHLSANSSSDYSFRVIGFTIIMRKKARK